MKSIFSKLKNYQMMKSTIFIFVYMFLVGVFANGSINYFILTDEVNDSVQEKELAVSEITLAYSELVKVEGEIYNIFSYLEEQGEDKDVI